MNRDTLYSAAVFDLTEPVTIRKPERGGRYQSLVAINQDHSALIVEHDAGDVTLTQERMGTRYAIALVRTFMNPYDAADVSAAHALQDQITISQRSVGVLSLPDWDTTSMLVTRELLNKLASSLDDSRGCFGDAKKLNPIKHLLCTAFGWGGNPDEASIYENVVPEKNDGKTPYRLTLRDVPVDGFWSVTVYNEKGFMEQNALNRYSVNDVTATREGDGSVVIHFGGKDTSRSNYLPITPGWNYIVRLYQPRPELLAGQWKTPQPEIVQ